jgi:methyl-accepting chemotaxis protein
MKSTMRIATMLSIAFGSLVLVIAAAGGVALVNFSNIALELDHIVLENSKKLHYANTMSESVHIMARVMRTELLLTDRNQVEAEHKKLDEAAQTYEKARTAMHALPTGDKGRASRAAIDKAAAAARPLTDRVLTLAKEGKTTEAVLVMMEEAGPAAYQWQQALHDNIELVEQDNQLYYEMAKSEYRTGRATMIAAVALALLLALVMGAWVTRRITRDLGAEPAELKEVADHIRDGELFHAIDSRGNTTSVMASFARMRDMLRGISATVRQGADNVATASAQIAAGNNDLSARTEAQASALQQTAASMEELGSTVRQNADNARQANQLALQASGVAVDGGEVVSQVVDTMRGINESSRKIADIISVIDGIAFQTNILALNAAVEAARAGEQGRGFAVVASEVRSLAQRSAGAAKEIKALINASVERVEHGTALVDKAGATMQEVVASIRRVTDIMGEISAASSEQSAGVGQISEAVTQMDRATQQNAALVEESAAAAESLRAQALQLVEAVAVFKLEQGDGDRRSMAMTPLSPMRRAPAPAPRATAPRPAPAKPRPLGSAAAPKIAGAAPRALPNAAAPAGTRRPAGPSPAPGPGKADDGDWTSF